MNFNIVLTFGEIANAYRNNINYNSMSFLYFEAWKF